MLKVLQVLVLKVQRGSAPPFDASGTVNVILSVSGTQAINLGQTTLTLPPLGNVDVGVNFNCSRTSPRTLS